MSSGQPRDGDVCAAEHDADWDYAPALWEPSQDRLNDGRNPKQHTNECQHVDRDDRCWTKTVANRLFWDFVSIALRFALLCDSLTSA